MKYAKRVCKDEGVFEALACPCGLVRATCVSDIAKEADEGVVVGWGIGVVKDCPLGWFGVLRVVSELHGRA